MQKKAALLLALAMLFSCLALTSPVAHAEEAEAKLGLGIVTDVSGSTPATADAEGRAKVDTTIVAVLLAADDTIVDVKIDTVQPYTFFNSTGVVTEKKDFRSKRELKDDYGMIAASQIGKEWYEQAEALESYMIGKTVADVMAMEVNEEFRPTDADLMASVTIHVDTYLLALEKAVQNAVALGSKADNTLGLAITANNNRSADADGETDGVAQAYLHVAAASVDADGVITAAVIDALQPTVTFDAEGQITSDVAAEVKTKNELGADYGMVNASGIQKEWYEQASAFAQYAVGKTKAELEALPVADGKTTDADLLASVTVTVTDMQTAMMKTVDDAVSMASGVKTGLAVLTSIAGSTSADGETDGRAKVDITMVAVLVDEDGTILDFKLDFLQPYTSWDAEGHVIEKKEFKTKRELGDDYGMRAASAIGLEWYEQADAFEQYVIGKTLEDVLALELDEEYRPADVDLAASVTIHVDSYVAALEKAVTTAKVLGASAEDELGLGAVAHNNRSADVGDEDGLAESYVHFGALTFNTEGIVTSAIIDASQARVSFDAEGKITSDITVNPLTKLELGDAYGMAIASEIGREWHEQADAYADFIVGKTQDEVVTLVNNDGKSADIDLFAHVTVTIDEMTKIVSKGYEDAFLAVR